MTSKVFPACIQQIFFFPFEKLRPIDWHSRGSVDEIGRIGVTEQTPHSLVMEYHSGDFRNHGAHAMNPPEQQKGSLRHDYLSP